MPQRPQLGTHFNPLFPLIPSAHAHYTSFTQLQRRRRRPEPPSCLFRCSRVLEPSLEVTNLPRPLLFPFPALGYARLLTGVRSHLHRVAPRWTATLWRLCVDVVPTLMLATLHPTSLSPSRHHRDSIALAPSSPVNLTTDMCGASAGGQGEPTRASRLILDAHHGLDGSVSNKPDLILIACLRSNRQDFSLPRAPAAGPGQSVSPVSPRPLTALSCLSVRARACTRLHPGSILDR